MASEQPAFKSGTWRIAISIPRDIAEAAERTDPVLLLPGLAHAIDELETKVAEIVRHCRANGRSWAQIGEALSVSKQAAWERFSGERWPDSERQTARQVARLGPVKRRERRRGRRRDVTTPADVRLRREIAWCLSNRCSLFASVAGLSRANRFLAPIIDRLLRFAVLPMGCALAVGITPASASSGHEAPSNIAESGPLTLRAGDQIVVTGSELRCVVSTASSASHPPTLVCGVGDVQSPLPGTYAFAIADRAALMIKSSATRQPELAAQEPEPTPRGGLFPVASTRAAATLKVGPGAILLVGGSDILCSVSSQAGTPTLTCGLAAGGSGTFIIGSYVGVISQRLALLSKLLSQVKFDTIFSKPQPAR